MTGEAVQTGSPLRVLVVMPSLVDTGAARVTISVCRHLDRRDDVSVVLYALRRDERGLEHLCDDLDVRFGSGDHGLSPSGAWVAARLAGACDVVVGGQEFGSGNLVAWAAARLRRRALVVHFQARPGPALSLRPSRTRGAELAVAMRAERLVCVAKAVADELAELGRDRARLAVVETAVDAPALRADAEAPAVVAGPDPFVVAVGRLSAVKGYDVLLEAFTEVVAAGLPHRLVILGEGDDRTSLQSLIDGRGLGDRVLLAGHVANAAATVAAAELLVLSSYSEGSPLVIREALALDVPVISTDCGGPREVLADGAYGALVPVAAPRELAAAIVDHLRDPERLRAAAQAGRTAIEAWTPAHMADAYLAQYRIAVHDRRRGRNR